MPFLNKYLSLFFSLKAIATAMSLPLNVENTAASGPAWRYITMLQFRKIICLFDFRDVTTSAVTTGTAGARRTTVSMARTPSSSPSSRRSRKTSARLGTSRTAMTAKDSAPRFVWIYLITKYSFLMTSVPMECVAAAAEADVSAAMTGWPAPGLTMTAPSAKPPLCSPNSFKI